MTIALATEAPAFDLPGVDGRQHSLDDYADKPALAVVWSCNHCPYVQAWEGRMIELQREFGDRGFGLVAISSNDADAYPEDSFDAMKARAAQQGFNFDYLYDEDQSVLNAYGAERTPEVFLFDGDRRLVYHGAIDDSREEEGVTQEYLRDAIEAVLAGDDPSVSDTPPVGCTVKRRPT
jgi:peroxiredoxin